MPPVKPLLHQNPAYKFCDVWSRALWNYGHWFMTRNFRGNRMIPAKLNKGNLIPYINQPARRFCTAKMWLLLRGTTTQPLQGSRKNPTERMWPAFRIPCQSFPGGTGWKTSEHFQALKTLNENLRHPMLKWNLSQQKYHPFQRSCL